MNNVNLPTGGKDNGNVDNLYVIGAWLYPLGSTKTINVTGEILSIQPVMKTGTSSTKITMVIDDTKTFIIDLRSLETNMYSASKYFGGKRSTGQYLANPNNPNGVPSFLSSVANTVYPVIYEQNKTCYYGIYGVLDTAGQMEFKNDEDRFVKNKITLTCTEGYGEPTINFMMRINNN